jgi:septal ring factor EnvC (AmiA/AmiB activator)
MIHRQNNTIISSAVRRIISELRTELQAVLVDLGHKNAFDLLLKEAWNPEQAAMGNSTLPTVSDKLNVMASIHNRKLIAALSRELKEKDCEIQELRQNIITLETKLNKMSTQIERAEEKKQL